MSEKLIVIKTADELQQVMDYLRDKDFVAFDTETNGVQKDSNIIGFSLCAEVDVAYYIITAYWDVASKCLVKTMRDESVIPLINILKEKKLVMHNAVFDCWMVDNNYKVQLIDSVHTDTMILGHLLNENRSNALKERALELWGLDSVEEQRLMKESVTKNGGVLTKTTYELYKADPELIAHYGAKDALLTLRLFFHDVPILFAEGLDKFFYDDESMPLLRGPTYQMNTTGLKVDTVKLQNLKAVLEAMCIEAEATILSEIHSYIKTKYPGDKKKNAFNIDSSQQMCWLLFDKLNNDFDTLTESGKELCDHLGLKTPYTRKARLGFISACMSEKGKVWGGKKKVKDYWTYLQFTDTTIKRLSTKYTWVRLYGEYKKNRKMLNTYVEGIQEREAYGVIRPNFLQHGTTSGRYSCKNPNFQNLPREDKRVKACISSRKGYTFVGADFSQLEPRVFASCSGDGKLQLCFTTGQDFYSVIGAEVFDKPGCSLRKNDNGSFAKLYPSERQDSKTFALAATYGANAHRLSKLTGKSIDDTEDMLKSYFTKFNSVRQMMLDAHKQVREHGVAYSLYGRPRRMPKAMLIDKLYGNEPVDRLPFEYKNLLNLSVNHRIQSSAASVMNRAAIAVYERIKDTDIKIVMQVHDELILEGPDKDKDFMLEVLKDCMENTVKLPGVSLVAEPKAAYNLAELK